MKNKLIHHLPLPRPFFSCQHSASHSSFLDPTCEIAQRERASGHHLLWTTPTTYPDVPVMKIASFYFGPRGGEVRHSGSSWPAWLHPTRLAPAYEQHAWRTRGFNKRLQIARRPSVFSTAVPSSRCKPAVGVVPLVHSVDSSKLSVCSSDFAFEQNLVTVAFPNPLCSHATYSRNGRHEPPAKPDNAHV
jgi:hypothetical protein